MADRQSLDSTLRYMRMFNNFFEKGKMASTYKAVFLHALTDIGKYGQTDLTGRQWIHYDGDQIQLDLDFIAIRLAKYYWDMEVAFNLRHTAKRMVSEDNPEADIAIINIIREITETKKKDGIQPRHYTKPPSLMSLSSPEMTDFRTTVIKKAMREVLINLPNDMPGLYQRVRGKRYIILESELIEFLKEFSSVIKQALNYVLALHLEKINPDARRIAAMIDMEKEFEAKMCLKRVIHAEYIHQHDKDRRIE